MRGEGNTLLYSMEEGLREALDRISIKNGFKLLANFVCRTRVASNGPSRVDQAAPKIEIKPKLTQLDVLARLPVLLFPSSSSQAYVSSARQIALYSPSIPLLSIFRARDFSKME